MRGHLFYRSADAGSSYKEDPGRHPRFVSRTALLERRGLPNVIRDLGINNALWCYCRGCCVVSAVVRVRLCPRLPTPPCALRDVFFSEPRVLPYHPNNLAEVTCGVIIRVADVTWV